MLLGLDNYYFFNTEILGVMVITYSDFLLLVQEKSFNLQIYFVLSLCPRSFKCGSLLAG